MNCIIYKLIIITTSPNPELLLIVKYVNQIYISDVYDILLYIKYVTIFLILTSTTMKFVFIPGTR
jgi:hypothetical protein